MNKTWALGGLLTLFIVVAVYLKVSGYEEKQDNSGHFSSKFIKTSLEIINENQQPVDGLKGWLWLPSSMDGRQVVSIDKSSVPLVVDSASGLQTGLFEMEFIGPFSRKRLDLNISVQIFNRPVAAKNSEKSAVFLAGEPLLSVSDQNVVALAHSLRSEHDYESAANIYKWIRGNINNSPYRIEPKSATEVLATKSGDCTDQMMLAVALLRVLGVPARMMSGYLAERPSIKLDSSMYHNWAEVLIDGHWLLLDAQRGVFDERYDEYLVYGVINSDSIVKPRFGIENHKKIAINML